MNFVAFATVLLTSTVALAQESAATTHSTEAWTPAKSIGMYAYPKNHQSSEQQLKDESQCYGAAKQQTGVDPQASAPAQPSANEQTAAQEQAAQQPGKPTPKGGTVKGSAGGAAGGAAIGAIAGSAGKGAAIGATAGAVAGRRQQKKTEAQAKSQASQQVAQSQQEAHAQATAQHQAALDSFKRAFSACMDARGYSVRDYRNH
jgi:OmpA family protein